MASTKLQTFHISLRDYCSRREQRTPEAVWDGAVRRKLAVRAAGTCRQRLQPSTRPPEQVISVSWPSMRTRMKVVSLLDTQEQRLVLLWILLGRRAKKANEIFTA